MRKKNAEKQEEIVEEELIKNMVNFHKENSKDEQKQILATNAHGMDFNNHHRHLPYVVVLELAD